MITAEICNLCILYIVHISIYDIKYIFYANIHAKANHIRIVTTLSQKGMLKDLTVKGNMT